MAEDLASLLECNRILPTVTVTEADHAVDVARALLDGGVAIMEVLLRSNAAIRAIEAVAARVPEMVVGAGTVLDLTDVNAAVDAGAAFLVSPGLSALVAARARTAVIPFLPGAITPTEMIAARDQGLPIVKVFPASSVGPGGLSAMAAAFADMRFVPTGGVNAGNAGEWLSHPSVLAVGGSWIASAALIDAGDWSAITSRAKAARSS